MGGHHRTGGRMTTPGTGVVLKLQSDPAVVALTGGRIYQVHLPQGPDYPAVVVQTIAEPVPYHLRGTAGLVPTRVQVDAYAQEGPGIAPKTLVDQVAAAVDASLSGRVFMVGPAPPLQVFTVLRINRIDSYEAEEFRVFRVLQEYTVWSRPQVTH